jgi:hypothetical protein
MAAGEVTSLEARKAALKLGLEERRVEVELHRWDRRQRRRGCSSHSTGSKPQAHSMLPGAARHLHPCPVQAVLRHQCLPCPPPLRPAPLPRTQGHAPRRAQAGEGGPAPGDAGAERPRGQGARAGGARRGRRRRTAPAGPTAAVGRPRLLPAPPQARGLCRSPRDAPPSPPSPPLPPALARWSAWSPSSTNCLPKAA